MTAVRMAAATRWWPYSADAASRLRLYAFPFAGGGTLAYEPWRRALPDRIACVAARLPGRETRMTEPALSDLPSVVHRATTELLAVLEPPYALYGHSMGALVALHVLRELSRRGAEPPLGLIVAARPAPHLPSSKPGTDRVGDERIVSELRQLGGLPDEIAANAAAAQLFLPLLRADLTLNELRETPAVPINAPIMALAGVSDPRVSPPDVAAWHQWTSSEFRFEVVPGDHFFAFSDCRATLRLVVDQLDGWANTA
jgi:medium-chain acyl-[acyl-carrier-protein] hydrolase